MDLVISFLSQGSAEVVYTRRNYAFAALKRYNNVLLDGRQMKIEIVGLNREMPISARVNVIGANGRKKRTVVMTYVTCSAVSNILAVLMIAFTCFPGCTFLYASWNIT